MAQISLDSIKRIEKYRNTIHDKVYTTYTAFEADGENMCRSTLMAALVVRIQRRLANHFNLIGRLRNFW